MSLQLSYPSPFSVDPVEDAVAWIASLAVDFSSATGAVVVNVNQDEASANGNLPPFAQDHITLGQTFGSGDDAVTFPTLAEVLTDNAEAFGSIRAYLYTKLKLLPKFAEATDL
jgi:hypothetical protein